MNNILKKFVLPLFALVIGIVFVVMGFVDIKQSKSFPEIDVTVTRVEKEISYDADNTMTEETTVYVSYTVDGEEYEEIILNNASGSLKEGDKLTVHYNPEKPEYVTAATTTSAIVKIALGAVAALAGVIIGLLAIIKGK